MANDHDVMELSEGENVLGQVFWILIASGVIFTAAALFILL